jgi:hypothetical protein
MPNNNLEEYNLFAPRRSNDIFSDQPTSEDDLFPGCGSSGDDLYPELRTTEEDLRGIKSFIDSRNLSPLAKKRLINYYRDIDLRQRKSKGKSNDSLF